MVLFFAHIPFVVNRTFNAKVATDSYFDVILLTPLLHFTKSVVLFSIKFVFFVTRTFIISIDAISSWSTVSPKKKHYIIIYLNTSTPWMWQHWVQSLATQAIINTYVSGFSSRSWTHVQDSLPCLGGKGHDWQETGRSLDHVMASQVLRSGSWIAKNTRFHLVFASE